MREVEATMEITGGTSIAEAAQQMVNEANRSGDPQFAYFNSLPLVAHPGDTAAKIMRQHSELSWARERAADAARRRFEELANAAPILLEALKNIHAITSFDSDNAEETLSQINAIAKAGIARAGARQ